MICDRCGAAMDYLGIDDGGGGDGACVCDQWECPECGYVDETDCHEYPDWLDGVQPSWIGRAVDEIIAEENNDDPTNSDPF